jgi:multidrug efflux pump subunit AcrA (membrane-fusion protein)
MANFPGKNLIKTIAGIVITAILAAGLIFIPSILAEDAAKPLEAATEEMPVFSVKAADAQTRTLRSYLEVNGDIVSDRQVRVFPDTSGKLAQVLVTLGSVVRQGDLIAETPPVRALRIS